MCPYCVAVGAVPVLSKDSMSGKKGHRLAQVKTPHNPLDSTSPMMKKGKQREVPKAKKHGLPGPSIHGIFQARIPEWVAFPTPT